MVGFLEAATVVVVVLLVSSWVLVIALCRAAAAGDVALDAPEGSIDMSEFEREFTRGEEAQHGGGAR